MRCATSVGVRVLVCFSSALPLKHAPVLLPMLLPGREASHALHRHKQTPMRAMSTLRCCLVLLLSICLPACLPAYLVDGLYSLSRVMCLWIHQSVQRAQREDETDRHAGEIEKIQKVVPAGFLIGPSETR